MLTQTPQKVSGYTIPDVAQLFHLTTEQAAGIVKTADQLPLSEQELTTYGTLDPSAVQSALKQLSQHPNPGGSYAHGQTFAGFTIENFMPFLGVSSHDAALIIDIGNHAKDSTNLSYDEQKEIQRWQHEPNASPVGGSTTWEVFNNVLQHLAEHPAGSHYGGDFSFNSFSFNPIEAITRFFTIRPQSFTPANITRSFAAESVAEATFGVDAKVKGQDLASTSTHDSSLVGSGYTGGYSFGQVTSGDPHKKETLFEKLFRLGGGAVDAFLVGRVGGEYLTTTSTGPGSPSSLEYGPPTPLTAGQTAGNTLASSFAGGAYAYGSGQLAQIVLGVFGPSIGGAILAAFHGDFFQAYQSLTAPTSTRPSIYYGPGPQPQYFASGGGGGGSGFGSGNTGQSSNTTLVYLGIASVGAVLLWLWLKRR